ncbi:MAG: hypothetical protein RLZZ01_1458 [Actinomycetota bacterium]
MTLSVAALGAGCSDGLPDRTESDDGSGDAVALQATVPIPPERSTPFCVAMTELADRLENDPPPDVGAAIAEVYRELVDDVPDAIRADFFAVLAELDGQAVVPETTVADDTAVETLDPTGSTEVPVTTDDPLSDEGYSPDDTPAGRINSYVDFVCRGVVNNPGPPDTQPL